MASSARAVCARVILADHMGRSQSDFFNKKGLLVVMRRVLAEQCSREV